MVQFKDYFIGFILVGLFTLSIFFFAIGTANNYDKNASYVTSNKLDLTSLEEQLNKTRNEGEKLQEAYTKDKPFISTGVVMFDSLWGGVKVAWISVNELARILFQGIANVLHIDAMVLGIMSALLALALIFSAWRVFKLGE